MAGAGAGKTSTLVGRILDRVLDGSPPVPVDRILVVTFNEAAAAEMRHRLALSLDQRRLGDPDNSRIAEQCALLETAAVSTLHAFCLRLIRDHFHELGLDPQFVVQDETQTRLQRTASLREILNRQLDHAASAPQNPKSFLKRHARDGLRALSDLIVRVHDYAFSLPEPGKWFEAQRTAWLSLRPDLWSRETPQGIADWAADWAAFTRQLALSDPSNIPAQECAAALNSLVAEPRTPDGLTEVLRSLLRAGDRKRFEKEKKSIARWLKPLRPILDDVEVLIDLLGCAAASDPDHPSSLELDWRLCRDDVLALLDLTVEFSRTFEAARRAAAGVDFTDLEQLTLKLLWNPDRAEPTPLAQRWQESFDLVFVDEYQDINGAQDRILQCLSRPGEAANRFYVGDVKQSIYRFRRADPRIFQQYSQSWRVGPLHSVAPLTENFRSHEIILRFVNATFREIMRPRFGGISYDDDAALRLGAPEARPHCQADPSGRIEFHLLVTDRRASVEAANSESVPADEAAAEDSSAAGDDAQDDDLDTEEAQARLVAQRIRTLRDQGTTVWDSSERAHRPLTWRDVVVLHPAPRSVSERWARAFGQLGVPMDARRGGFFDALEVSDLVHLIRILDNPRQDLPLLAVLRSPLVGMGVNELAAVRIVEPKLALWDALQTLALHPEPADSQPTSQSLRTPTVSARAKAANFLACYDRWRHLAIQGSVAACLETVLADTCYEAWLLGQERADARRANLRRLLALTRQFDSFQRHGLFRFIQFLEAQSDAADPMESAPSAPGDSVRLMSMHQSKGLEFPIVVVAGLARRFNTEDLRGDWLLDEVWGVCPPVVPPDRQRGYPSLSRWFAELRQRRELIGEQMRLLYVACTRPTERLLLVGATRESRLRTWSSVPQPLPDRIILDARCFLDWLAPLLPVLSGQSSVFSQNTGESELIHWHFHESAPGLTNVSRTAPAPGSDSPAADPAPQEPAHLVELHTRLNRAYPWPRAVLEPAKAAVTSLRRQWMSDEESAGPTPRPSFPSSNPSAPASVTAVQRGLAHHLFNECVDLNQTSSRDKIESEIQRLTQLGLLSSEDAESLDAEALTVFWSHPIADVLRTEPEAVHRELPFTLRLRPADVARIRETPPVEGFGDDDFQVVQGIVDLALIRPDEIWIIDFKTDRVTTETVGKHAVAYQDQLRLYAWALSEIYHRPVTQRWLYFIQTRQFVAVD